MRELEMFKVYMRDEKNLSINTVNSYSSDIEQFFKYAKKTIRTVKPQDISDFIIFLRNEGRSVTTTNRKISAIKSFYKFLIKNNLAKNNPANSVENGKLEQRLPKSIPVNDIEKIIGYADNLRDKTMLEILYGTGFRRFEVGSLKVNDIDFRSESITTIGKGNKERTVPINPTALSVIKEYLKDGHNSEWLFPSRKDRSKHISNRQINEIIKKCAEKANVSGITPHKFRHTFCSELFENGADIKTIQDMAGHGSINSTNIYTKISYRRNKEEYLRCHPRARKENVSGKTANITGGI